MIEKNIVKSSFNDKKAGIYLFVVFDFRSWKLQQISKDFAHSDMQTQNQFGLSGAYLNKKDNIAQKYFLMIN